MLRSGGIHSLLLILALLVPGAWGCSGGGTTDVPTPDSGTIDVSQQDVGTPDTAEPDTSPDVAVGDPDIENPCETDDECVALLPASGPCQVSRCVDGGCALEDAPRGTDCDDGLQCTENDRCEAGACVGGPALDCNDDNPCTDDACDEELGCTNTPNDRSCDDKDRCTVLDACSDGVCAGFASADACPCDSDEACVEYDDGDPCNGHYECDGAACVAAAPRECEQPDDPCIIATCDVAEGGCVVRPASDGTSCDDGDECTVDDVCTDGVCAGTQGACTCSTHDDCAAYDDGDRCNGLFRCEGGQCLYDPDTVVVCAAPTNPCQRNVCDPSSGDCVTSSFADGESCEDGNACTSGETCQAGTCAGGESLDCDDGNACTWDRCDYHFGCVHEANAIDCDDGDPCTVHDRCAAGVCQGFAAVCDDQDPCTEDRCDPDFGCVAEPLSGVACSDGNPCTQGDACVAGACVAGPVDLCGTCVADTECMGYDDDDVCNGVLRCLEGRCLLDPATVVTCDFPTLPCQERRCEPATGACLPVMRGDGAPCDDGNPCTQSGHCQQGMCVSDTNDCDDGNPCTDDLCNPTDGCTHTVNTGSCQDGNECSQGDLCVDAVCRPGAQDDCGACSHAEDCLAGDDGDVCNGVVACVAGRCALAADSLVQCPAVGPDACVVPTCDAETGTCGETPLPDEAPCDDGNACTADDRCGAAGCVGTPVACDDGNPCTDDSCDPTDGCRFVPNGAACDDGNACTNDDACDGGVCRGVTPVVCDDGNPCTNDTCNPVSGACTSTENMAPCDDGSACTGGDTCRFGECIGIPLSCEDGNPCTADSCDELFGCVHDLEAAEGEDCDDGQPCTLGDYCSSGVCVAGDFGGGCLEFCGDGQDNDNNGLTDCFDPVCADLPSCTGVGICDEAGEILCDGEMTGSLSGAEATDRIDAYPGYACAVAGYEGPELGYRYTASCSGTAQATMTIDMTDFPSQPRVDIFAVSADELGECVTQSGCISKGLITWHGGIGTAEVFFRVEANANYFVVVDGRDSAMADFTLNLTCYCD